MYTQVELRQGRYAGERGYIVRQQAGPGKGVL